MVNSFFARGCEAETFGEATFNIIAESSVVGDEMLVFCELVDGGTLKIQIKL